VNKYFLLGILFIAACTGSSNTAKPPLTIEEFDRESLELKGVLMKFIQENDPAIVHEISVAAQSTFLVNCVPVGLECNQYHNIVTKIIEATQNHKFSIEQKMEILKMYYQMEESLASSRVKLISDWKKYAP
jgi:hypothetical protein